MKKSLPPRPIVDAMATRQLTSTIGLAELLQAKADNVRAAERKRRKRIIKHRRNTLSNKRED